MRGRKKYHRGKKIKSAGGYEKLHKDYRKYPMLENIFEARVDHALKEALKKDEIYQKKERQVNQMVRRIELAGLSKEQWKVVDETLSACNTQESEYARVAYGLGFKDGVHLTMEIFLDLQI